ncbi:MAG: SDR family oxidoreductase [Acidobacteriota bacterium]
MGVMVERRLVLVTGATGYVGGRLVPRLLAAGYAVRCLARDPASLENRRWKGAELVRGDLLDPTSLTPALRGVTDAYYLVHSMASGPDFDQRDRRAAASFRDAASLCGLKRIIFLGGLADEKRPHSPHMKSRLETGRVLRDGRVPVTEFRASIIVGSASLSFELIRYLGERLPVMVAPRWVTTRCQPIGIGDVLDYLIACLEEPRAWGKVIEIGGADVLTYKEMMLQYARMRGLRRAVLTIPVLTPRLSSYWLGFVTPIPVKTARHLIESVRSESVCSTRDAATLFPAIRPQGYSKALAAALRQLEQHEVETSWTGAVSSAGRSDVPRVRLADERGLMSETRTLTVAAAPETLFQVVASIGGEQGWYYANVLWRLRGALDRLCGGVGLRRGRRHPSKLHVGEALDFWRVEAWEEPKTIRLRAEMRVPGRAWLQFSVLPAKDGCSSVLIQKALFAPRGLFGFLYWYGLYPIHGALFSGMAAAIARRAEAADRPAPQGPA